MRSTNSSRASSSRIGDVRQAKTACSIFHASSAGFASVRNIVVGDGSNPSFFASATVVSRAPPVDLLGTKNTGAPDGRYKCAYLASNIRAAVIISWPSIHDAESNTDHGCKRRLI